MSAEEPSMNAKARRKLLRQQQQQQQQQQVQQQQEEKEAPAAPVAVEPVHVAAEEEAVAAGDKPLNAKQRRRLARQAAMEAQTASAPEATTTGKAAEKAAAEKAAAKTTGEKLNAKQRRLLARQATRGADAQADAPAGDAPATKREPVAGKKRKRRAETEAEGGEEADGKPRKSIHLTLFVGQLPFKATEAQVRAHFAEAGEITLRMLTDKKTKRFKGTAFIEVKDSKALGAALSRHHTLLNGRRINVELTAGGGGNKSEQRRAKIDQLRKKQSSVQVDKARALLQKRADAPESKVTPEDIDDRVVDFLSWFDYETAKRALDEFDRCVSDRVMNRKAFFMGILKRFVQTDGDE